MKQKRKNTAKVNKVRENYNCKTAEGKSTHEAIEGAMGQTVQKNKKDA